MKFLLVSECFQILELESSRLAMTRLLAALLQKANAKEAEIICNLALGQLYPPYIGTQFGIAEKTMVTVVANALEISIDSAESMRTKRGDIGSLLDSASWAVEYNITVQEVYEVLKELEALEGTGSQEQKVVLLTALLRKLDPLSAKYVVRIVLNKLRLGFSDMTIIDAISWMLVGNKSVRAVIEHAYSICADIGLIVCKAKEGGLRELEHMKMYVGVPVIPAAAERMSSAQAIIDKLGSCVAQLKLDGFRLQIHFWHEKGKAHIKFYSRNLLDMSDMFPDLTTAFKKLSIQSLICEGEAIGYDSNTNSFLPFQKTVKRKRKHKVEETTQELPLRLFLFDLLYLDGLDCLNLPHKIRRQGLETLFKPIENDVIHIIQERPISTAKQLESYFDEAITEGLEGLVVKKPDAIYQAGKRNFNWIKLKRQQFGHIDDTIDAVVLGYNYGSGKRTELGIGAFLAGVYDHKHDRFETIAKVGTGLSDSEWREFKKACDALACKECPKNVLVASELEPDVWVNPQLVVSLHADEITLSPLHTAGKTDTQSGYALRFPRFISYRPDKNATQATSVTEIVSLYKKQ